MRRGASPTKPRRARIVSFLAPVGGLVKNQNIARPASGAPQSAEKLVNIFPTATGAELRGGSDRYATLGEGDSSVLSFMRYKNGSSEKLFAATNFAIYDITIVADPMVSPAAVVAGMSSGHWSSVQFATTGAVALVAVNGEDDAQIYDGTNWFAINSENLYRLAYDEQTVNFTVGATVTGSTSGANGKIVAIEDNGTNGTLVLTDFDDGPFQNNEILTDTAGGSAKANGVESLAFNGVTGIATDQLSYVWTYKSRLFFIERETMNFWYASVDQLGGALTRFPMAGIFPQGGSLLFGASWSLDTGADGGLSAQCIFVTTEGEVAVFQGADPGAADGWSLVGVYRIGKPLGPNAWHRAGADIVINTDIGHVPLSQAINRDLAALSPASVSFPIETAWNEAVALRRFADWHCTIWPERQMLLIALPTGDGMEAKMFAANVRTGRWCEFTGWDGKCLISFQGRLFFGSTEGKVVEAYVTGLDQGQTYTGIYVPLFDDLRNPGALKVVSMARATMRSNSPLAVDIAMQFDFTVDLPPAPSAQIMSTGNLWGVAEWGNDEWGGDDIKIIEQDWVSVSGAGYAMAPALQFTSGSTAPLAAEIVRIDVLYDTGDLVS